MPQFFFELMDGIALNVPRGLWCRNENDAKKKAATIATHIASADEGSPDQPPRYISVKDKRGRELDTVIVRRKSIALKRK